MDRTPIRVLFVEDSEVDVELALHSLEQGGFEVAWDRVDAEEDLKRALGGARRTQAMVSFLAAGSLKPSAAKFN